MGVGLGGIGRLGRLGPPPNGVTITLVFARKITVEYRHDGAWSPAPQKWIDNFAMRSFTNDSIFDDTLPVGDGRIEIGARVPLDRLKAAMEDWFHRKGYIGKGEELRIEER